MRNLQRAFQLTIKPGIRARKLTEIIIYGRNVYDAYDDAEQRLEKQYPDFTIVDIKQITNPNKAVVIYTVLRGLNSVGILKYRCRRDIKKQL